MKHPELLVRPKPNNDSGGVFLLRFVCPGLGQDRVLWEGNSAVSDASNESATCIIVGAIPSSGVPEWTRCPFGFEVTSDTIGFMMQVQKPPPWNTTIQPGSI